jgi:hypothetical protein
MEQDKTDRILEVLLARMDADKAESEAAREADKEELMAKMDKMDADNCESKAHQEEMMAELKATIKSGQQEMIKAIMGASRESMEACKEKTKALPETTEACPEVTPACLEEEEEQTPDETEAVEEPQEVLDGVMEVEEERAPEPREVMAESREVPEGASDEEAFGATEDRTGEQCLAVRRHIQRKKWALVNGGPQQKFAAASRWFTRHAVPALLKGHVRKGPRRNCHSGIRGPGKTFRSRMEGRSLKQRQIKGNVA